MHDHVFMFLSQTPEPYPPHNGDIIKPRALTGPLGIVIAEMAVMAVMEI